MDKSIVDKVIRAHLMRTFDLSPRSFGMLSALIDGILASKECLPNYANASNPLLPIILKYGGYTRGVGDLPVDILFGKEMIRVTDSATGEIYSVTCGKEYTIKISGQDEIKLPRSLNAFSIAIINNMFIEQLGPRDRGDRFNIKAYPLNLDSLTDAHRISLFARAKAINEMSSVLRDYLDPISLGLRPEMDNFELKFENLGYSFVINPKRIGMLEDAILLDMGSSVQKMEYSPYEYPLNSNGHAYLYINPKEGVCIVLYETAYLEEMDSASEGSDQYVLLDSETDISGKDYDNIYVVESSNNSNITEFRSRGATLVAFDEDSFKAYSSESVSPVARMVSLASIKSVGFSELNDPSKFKTKRRFNLRKSFMPIIAWRLTSRFNIKSNNVDEFEDLMTLLD